MHRFGHNFIDRLHRNESGVASVAELLIVLAVSSILFISLLNGQEFVSRLSQRFFDTASLETEARLLLDRIQRDVSGMDVLRQPDENRWLLIDQRGDTTDYRIEDSTLARNGESCLRKGIRLEEFSLAFEFLDADAESWQPDESQRPTTETNSEMIRVTYTLSKLGKRVEIDTLCPLRKRAPGA